MISSFNDTSVINIPLQKAYDILPQFLPSFKAEYPFPLPVFTCPSISPEKEVA
jgi:hypothetical protein